MSKAEETSRHSEKDIGAALKTQFRNTKPSWKHVILSFLHQRKKEQGKYWFCLKFGSKVRFKCLRGRFPRLEESCQWRCSCPYIRRISQLCIPYCTRSPSLSDLQQQVQDIRLGIFSFKFWIFEYLWFKGSYFNRPQTWSNMLFLLHPYKVKWSTSM